MNDVAAVLADWLAAYFSNRYGVSGQASVAGAQSVTISGVTTFADYQNALQLLKSVNGIDAVDVAGVDGDVLMLTLSLKGRWSQIRSNLRLDQRLSPTVSDTAFEWRTF